VQKVQETEQTSADFVFRQYNLAVLSHYSYLIGSGGEALIVDPDRDISRYLVDAQELGLKITPRLPAPIRMLISWPGTWNWPGPPGRDYRHAATKAGHPHTPVKDGDAIAFGTVRAVIVTTPGHTPTVPAFMSIIQPPKRSRRWSLPATPYLSASGGRPDLMGEGTSAAELAEMGYHSWQDKLSGLPDDTKFFPAHGAGLVLRCKLKRQARLHDRRATQGKHLSAA